MKTKNTLFLLLFNAIFLFTSCNGNKTAQADKGVIDLTNWDFDNDRITTLNGEWEFYWNQLHTPKHLTQNLAPSYITLPGVWNDVKHNNKPITGIGFATFRLKIKNNLTNEKLGLRIPYHFTTYKLWVDDELIAENGVTGKSKETVTPQTLPTYVFFNATNEDIILTLQISNHHYDKGGAPASYKFGLEKQIKALRSRQVALDLFLTGILFIMALHHLGLYYLMKKEIYTLYFSMVCFFVMLRTIGLGESVLIELFPDFNFEIYTKLLFIGFFIVPPLFILFIQRLFPQDSKRKLGRVFMILGVVFSISLFFNAIISTKLLLPYVLILVVSYIYLLSIVIRACVKKREGAFIAFIGISIMVVTVFNDMLYDQQIINTGYYSSYGLVFFVFSQSFLLSLKFSNTFKSIKKLSKNIKNINIANSRFVPSEFLSFLGKESIVDVELGDHVTKHMTVFFADIRSFTTISESLTPEENFHFINSLLNRLGPIVRHNNGFIDKYIGDSIMALFPHNPTEAIVAASEILKELEQYNIDNKAKNVLPIRLGIGINSGSLMLGTIGEEKRMDGTVISDTVNIASRLEGLSKLFDSNIIISDNVLSEVTKQLDLDYRFLGNVPVKGKINSIAVYDVFSFDSEEIRALKLKIKVPFEKAIHLYEETNFIESKLLFQDVLEIFPNDKASRYYLDLIHA